MFGPGSLLRKAMQLTASPGLILPSTHWISDLKTVRFLTSAAWGQGPTSYAALIYQDSKDFSTSHNGVIFQRCPTNGPKNENWKSILKVKGWLYDVKWLTFAICKKFHKLRNKLLFTVFLLKKLVEGIEASPLKEPWNTSTAWDYHLLEEEYCHFQETHTERCVRHWFVTDRGIVRKPGIRCFLHGWN